MPRTALLLTWSGDHYTPDRVAEALVHRGAQAVRVDTDLFPTALSLRWSLDGQGRAVSGSGPLAAVDPEDVVGLWWRRFWAPQLPEDLDPEHAVACARESHATLMGFFRSFPRAVHVNDPRLERAAEDKLWQLAAARASGLRCPQTLITNEPEAVKSFFERLDGRVVTKMLTPYSRSMEGDRDFVYTSRLEPEDLLALDGLRYCPMVFQEEIPRAREHRVIWVAGQILVGSLETGADDTVDWRRQLGRGWQRSVFPPSLVPSLSAGMARLGLVYGAFDFIETPEGEWVFLEVNPAGEWGMIERDLGLPVGDAIAAALLGDTP